MPDETELERRARRAGRIRRSRLLPVISDPMSSVARDATSNKYVPANAAQWTSTMSAAGISSGNPLSMWLMQEASGTLADSIGSAPLTVDSMSYSNAVTGWTRTAMGGPDLGGFYSLFNNTDTNLPDTSTTSALLLGYVAITGTPAADRGVLLVGDTRAIVTSANVPKVHNGTLTGTGASSVTTVVRPWVIRHDVTGLTTTLFTDLEKVTATFAPATSNKRAFFGAAVEASPGIRVLYGALWKGTAAEISDADVRSLLQTLDWTVSF